MNAFRLLAVICPLPFTVLAQTSPVSPTMTTSIVASTPPASMVNTTIPFSKSTTETKSIATSTVWTSFNGTSYPAATSTITYDLIPAPTPVPLSGNFSCPITSVDFVYCDWVSRLLARCTANSNETVIIQLEDYNYGQCEVDWQQVTTSYGVSTSADLSTLLATTLVPSVAADRATKA